MKDKHCVKSYEILRGGYSCILPYLEGQKGSYVEYLLYIRTHLPMSRSVLTI